MIGMEHGAFLNVAVLADHNGFGVAADHNPVPDIGVRLDGDLANDGDGIGQECSLVDVRADVA